PRLNASAMVVFAEVVTAGSFSAAAQRLGLSNASVSREIARLERRLGAQLLRRTTRKMSLTEVGETFYARCQRVVEESEQAAWSVSEAQAEPRGEIRLAAPMSFGYRQLSTRLPTFLERFPNVRVHVELTDRLVDLVSERFDLAVRITGRLADAAYVQRRLCPIRFVACAAPSYLKKNGVPVTVADLPRHNCLNPSGLPWRGILRGHLSPNRRGWISGNLNLDNADALHRVALLGHGIVCLPTFIAGEDLRDGRLVRVLPKQLALEASAFAVHPQTRHPSRKVRALIDYLAASLGPQPEWDHFKGALRGAGSR
ncbi:MAG TPA: LysR family transcriptional regulator, partial [Myxococcota bacterium]|nr:LysR family transcriptional regulator [Myxococcota bacterium]